jgi:hypothetical protein
MVEGVRQTRTPYRGARAMFAVRGYYCRHVGWQPTLRHRKVASNRENHVESGKLVFHFAWEWASLLRDRRISAIWLFENLQPKKWSTTTLNQTQSFFQKRPDKRKNVR